MSPLKTKFSGALRARTRAREFSWSLGKNKNSENEVGKSEFSEALRARTRAREFPESIKKPFLSNQPNINGENDSNYKVSSFTPYARARAREFFLSLKKENFTTAKQGRNGFLG